VPTDWQIATVADADGDKKADLVWYTDPGAAGVRRRSSSRLDHERHNRDRVTGRRD